MGDGLDDAVWRIVTDMACAANIGDPGTFAALAKQLEEGTVPTAVGYLHLLLRQVVVDRAGMAKPTDARLAELADEASLHLSLLGKFTVPEARMLLHELFTGLLDGAPRGIFFVMYAAALLGALARNPQVELPTLRPWLRERCLELATHYPGRFEYLRPAEPT